MRTGRRGDRVLGSVRVAGLLVSLGGLVWLTVVLVTQGVNKAGSLASVISTAVAIVGMLVTLVTSWWPQRPAVGELTGAAQLTRVTEELRAAVWEQWRREAEARSLGDPDPMPVCWRLSDPAVMDHDEHIGPVPLGFAGRSDRMPALLDAFRRLHRRRLVIVGGPGSGKTTLAVQLVLQLLKDWQVGEPLPVLLSLASWDPQAQPRVQDWLADQLNQTYPDLRAFGADAACRLAEQGRLLPILDGLDEIAPERRREVIDRLNASLAPDTGLIMTSRTAEYTDTVCTSRVLTAAAVIEPEPLTPDEAAAYLTDRLPRQPDEPWQTVLTALRNHTAEALAEVVANPLGLWLLCVVHIDGRRDPQPLIDPARYPDAAAIHHHLLQELIPATVRARPPRRDGRDLLRPQRRHDPEQVRRWLTTLAIELRNANTRDWRWWRLARHTLTTRQIRLVYGLLVGLVITLGSVLEGMLEGALEIGLESGLFGLMLGLVFMLVFGLVFGLVVVLVFGLVFGLIFGLLFWLVGWSAFRDRDAPAHTDFRIRGRAPLGVKLADGDRDVPGYTDFGLRSRGMTLGANQVLRLLGVLTGVLVLGLVLQLVDELGNVLAGVLGVLMVLLMVGLPFWLVGGLVLGLVSFVTSPSIAQRACSPMESQRGDRRLTLVVASMLGLVGGLVGGLLGGLVGGLSGGLLGGLAFGLPMSGTCWPRFVVASLWLGTRRRLPLRLMWFLDDAYRLGLLRIVGPVYQFRHAALQDHLATSAKLTTAAAGPSTSLKTRE